MYFMFSLSEGCPQSASCDPALRSRLIAILNAALLPLRRQQTCGLILTPIYVYGFQEGRDRHSGS
jgi:hypothetical protein